MQLGYTSLWVFYVSTWLQIHRVLLPSNCCLMVVDRLLRSWTDAKKSFLTQKHLTHLIAAYSCKGFTTKVSVYHHQHGKCDLPLAPSISCHLRALGPFPHTPGTQISPLSSCGFFLTNSLSSLIFHCAMSDVYQPKPSRNISVWNVFSRVNTHGTK